MLTGYLPESLILPLLYLFNILTKIHNESSKLAPRPALFDLRGLRRSCELLNIYNQELMLWKRYRYVYQGHESFI